MECQPRHVQALAVMEGTSDGAVIVVEAREVNV